MRSAWLICRKDLKTRIRDRSALVVALLVPFALAFIFNAVFSGAAGGANIVTLGVADQDHGAAARTFIDKVLGGVAESGFISVRAAPDETTARRLVGSGRLSTAVVIPSGFSDAVQSGAPAALVVIGNANAPISADIGRSVAEGYAADLNRIRLSVTTVAASGRVTASAEELVNRAMTTAAPVTLHDVSTANKQLNAKSFYAAGMAVFFVFFTVGFGVAGLLEERADGTLVRLAAAPIGRSSILAGKMLTSLIMGLVSMSVLVLATSVLFGASWGPTVGVAVLVVAAVLAAMGVMALVATIAKTPEQAGQWQSVVAVILGLLGGAFFPVSQSLGVLSVITLATPQAWFLRGLGDLRAGSLGAVWTPTLAMLTIAAVTGALAMTRLRRTVEV